MLAHTSGATDTPGRRFAADSQRLYVSAANTYAKRRFHGGGEVRRIAAVALFVLGESVLASLSFGVAALPALITFFAGSLLLVRS